MYVHILCVKSVVFLVTSLRYLATRHQVDQSVPKQGMAMTQQCEQLVLLLTAIFGVLDFHNVVDI